MGTKKNKSDIVSQNSLILNHMKYVGGITPLLALNTFGCLRLSARIWDLRKEGHNIRMEMIKVSKYCRVARYTFIDKKEEQK